MLEHEYETMRKVEDSHWWYQLLRDMTVRATADALPPDKCARLLDAGCGTGGTMQALREHSPCWELHGVDVSPLALEHTRRRGFLHVTEGSVDALVASDASYDGVVSLDVLYHEKVDQEKALREFYRVLVPDGVLLLNLPALDCLRGRHDVAVGGARRYTAEQVSALLRANGFDIERVHCWNAWLFLPVLLVRLLSRRGLSTPDQSTAVASDLPLPAPLLNRVLLALGTLDAALCRLLHAPFGTSVFSVARKPKGG